MISIHKILTAIGFSSFTILAGCQTTPVTSGRVVISEENSKLVFYDPQAVSMRKEFYKQKTSRKGNIAYLGAWTDPSAMFPQTRIEYVELGVGYHFPTTYTPAKNIERLNFGEEAVISSGATGSLKTALGVIRYQFFNIGETGCISFSRTWAKGHIEHKTISSGNVLILGHHCVSAGQPLLESRASEIIRSIGVKGEGMPQPSAAWQTARAQNGASEIMEIPLSFNWPVFGNNLSGKFFRTGKSGDGKIWLSPSENVECAGTWKHLSGEIGTANPPEGEWSILCNNGLAANGSYKTSSSDLINGEGKDSEKNLISFSFMEPS